MLQSCDVELEAVTVLPVLLMWQLDVNLHHVSYTLVILQLCLVKPHHSTNHTLFICFSFFDGHVEDKIIFRNIHENVKSFYLLKRTDFNFFFLVLYEGHKAFTMPSSFIFDTFSKAFCIDCIA